MPVDAAKNPDLRLVVDEGALARSCVPVAMQQMLLDALRAVRIHATMPDTPDSEVSSLTGNLARLDVPGAISTVIDEQIATLTSSLTRVNSGSQDGSPQACGNSAVPRANPRTSFCT
jgi:hypothetical protein